MTCCHPRAVRPARVLVASLALLCLLSACHGPAVGTAKDSGRVQHIVLLWLKEPGKAEDRQRLVEAALSLSQLPGVIEIRAAQGLPGSGPIVDGSFDVVLLASFVDRQALEAFLAHPAHKQVDKEVVQPLVSKVLVYNAVE